MQAGLDYFSVILTKQFIDYFNTTDIKNDSPFTIDAPLWVLSFMLPISLVLALAKQVLSSKFQLSNYFHFFLYLLLEHLPELAVLVAKERPKKPRLIKPF